MAQSTKKPAVRKETVKKQVKLNRTQRCRQIASVRKKQITRAAYEVIAEKGYYNFTMMDIAKRAGVSSGLIHHYFKDKENMLVTLLREMQQDIRAKLEKATEHIKDPRQKLDIFMNQAFDLVESDREYVYVIFDFLTQIKYNDRMKRILTKLYRGYRDSCEAIVKEGIEKGAFKKTTDAHFIATLVITAFLGLREQYIIDNTAFFYREYTAKIKNSVFSMVLTKK
ncbi:MAG: TetR/AcrR family transcriptional regulator [Chloroflexi bacterium]|nr:TetR/AcrR family transcriptional regulator [Chloroflexota bacterium]